MKFAYLKTVMDIRGVMLQNGQTIWFLKTWSWTKTKFCTCIKKSKTTFIHMKNRKH